MKKNKMTFGEFKTTVSEIYQAFSQHCTWSELRVWDGVPGDILKERDCWYAIMRVNDTCCMMIQFSPDDDDEKPYTCWYDYTFPMAGIVNYPHWNFSNIEEAMHFCMREPMREYQNDMFDYIIHRPVVSPYNGVTGYQKIVCMSFVSAFDYLMAHKDDEKFPEGDWYVARHMSPLGYDAIENMYQIHSGRFANCDDFFLTLVRWGLPEYLYKQKNKISNE